MRSTTTMFAAALLCAVVRGAPGILRPRDCPGSATTTCGSKPNILLIVSDDTGYGDLGAFSPMRRGAPTPNLDQLAKDGMILSDFYAQPSCTPGRAALNTGRLPIRSGMTSVRLPGAGGGLPAAEWTLASVLKQAGYATYFTGKWHLGEADFAMPTAHGFDRMEYMLLHYQNAYTYHLPEFHVQLTDEDVARVLAETVGVLEGVAGEPPQEVLATRDITYRKLSLMDERIKDKAVAAVQELAAGDAPWFMSVNWMANHGPNAPQPRFRGASQVKNTYADKLVEMDALTGEVLAALEAAGAAEDTLVLYTVDNGAWQDVHPDSGYTPFRGSKGTVREGGMRVPTIVRWPGKIPAGAVSGEIASGQDVMATFARLAGVQLPTVDREGQPMVFDSFDLAPILFPDEFGDAGGKGLRDHLYYFTERDEAPAAVRFREWKALFDLRGDNGATAMGQEPAPILGWRGPARQTQQMPQLVNLWEDPQEREDMFLTPLRDNGWIISHVNDLMADIAVSFVDYPPREANNAPASADGKSWDDDVALVAKARRRAKGASAGGRARSGTSTFRPDLARDMVRDAVRRARAGGSGSREGKREL